VHRTDAAELSSEEARDAFHDALLDDDPAALYDRAPCGYVSTLPDGTIVKANATFLLLTGYDRQDLVGRRTFAQLLTAGGRIFHETHYAPMLQMQGSARAIALDIVCADGTRLPVLVNAVLERSSDGQPAIVRAAIFDATDRREYERELLRAKQRAEASEARAVALAQTLQKTLIPPTPPEIPGLDVAAAYRPAGDGSEVGGDFYDIFEVAAGDWVVAIGDVQGKGVDAAVVTALARHTIRAAAVNQSEPSEILSTLNTVLLHDDSERLCTVTLIRLRDADGTWSATASCAGHPAPLLSRAGAAPQALNAPGTVLGVLPTVAKTDTDATLQPGDSIVLYTDGVTEARRDGEFFGEERLVQVIASSCGSPRETAAALLDEVVRFQGGHPRDDIAIVAIAVPLR
jgi:sigma-B regulation protein RsbU (phosphoserine phosphatase)